MMTQRNSTKHVLSRISGFIRATTLLAVFLVALDCRAAVIEKDWCTINVPDVVVPGKLFEISVTIKPEASEKVKGMKLANHLHWAKKEGYGGFLSWHADQVAVAGQTFSFKHNPKIDQAYMTGIMPIVFLSQDGSFENNALCETLPVIPISSDKNTPTKPKEQAVSEEKVTSAKSRPSTATLKKSSLRVVPSKEPVREGDEFTVKVEYYLDASDNWADGTKIHLTPLGPWVDNPDGKYTKGRSHQQYGSLMVQTLPVAPGEGVVEFKYKMGKTFRYNDVAWMASFVGGDGKNWPWSVRSSGPPIIRTIDRFDLLVDAIGGAYTYDEKPMIKIIWENGPKPPDGASCKADFKIFNTKGNEVVAFSRDLVAGQDASVTLPEITERGVMLVEATIEGAGTRNAFFARIPNVLQKIGSKPTPFGCTNVGNPELAKLARRLGFTYCRHFVGWDGLEPRRGVWTLDRLDKVVESNRAAGLQPWICLIGPPAWAIPEADIFGAGYEPFSFDETAWKETVAYLTTRYKGRIWGFEWLNEILPGTKTKTPVEDYLKFCAIGTAEVRKIDPTMRIQMAGGLWPRNFRVDLLNNSIAQSIDVLPVHYSNQSSIREAIGDLASVGAHSSVDVWDNETAAGLSVWNMPARENIVQSVMQSKWVMRRWPEELVGGAKGIIYFGGEIQSAGNWSYLLDKNTPRPVMATLATLINKLAKARPLGSSYIEPGAVLYIFEDDGKGLAVASTVAADKDADTTISLNAGSPSIVSTDYQGNEKALSTSGGKLTTSVSSMPEFLDGFSLPHIAAYAGMTIGLQGDSPSPTVAIIHGRDASIPVCVRNPLSVKVSGNVSASLSNGTKIDRIAFSLEPGANSVVNMPIPSGTTTESTKGNVTMEWKQPISTSVTKPMNLTIIMPDQIGNLLSNGDMENASDSGGLANWSGNAKRVSLLPESGIPAPGYDGHAMRFDGNGKWQHSLQSVKLPVPGNTYLYTAWVWNTDMEAGSNLGLKKKDGTTTEAYIPSVFSAGTRTPFWRLLSHRRVTTEDLVSINFQPVCKGNGSALYDNLRVTIFEGSDYAAEARRVTKPITVDGKLDDWTKQDPIPLLCDNQVSSSGTYSWSPENLSGVAWMRWDDKALYFAAWVRDDQHAARKTGDECINYDSIILGIHPENRREGTDQRAFAWYISDAKPSGGSGMHTLFRPAKFSGGLSTGQLAKDSSVYEIAIRRSGNFTTYELRIPWSETGNITPAVGTKLGLSLQLNDYDGDGCFGSMNWGGGLKPHWSPSGFGVLTLID